MASRGPLTALPMASNQRLDDQQHPPPQADAAEVQRRRLTPRRWMGAHWRSSASSATRGLAAHEAGEGGIAKPCYAPGVLPTIGGWLAEAMAADPSGVGPARPKHAEWHVPPLAT